MAWTVSSGPASEPLTTSEVKTWLKVDTDADDTLISGLITAGRKYIERRSGVAMLTQTILETFDDWPEVNANVRHRAFRLSVSPVQSVTQIQYKRDSDGALTTWSSSEYVVDTTSKPARIGLAYDYTFDPLYNELDAIQITYVAGYTSTSDANFPSELITALKLWIAGKYENRQDYKKRYMDASEAIIDSVKVRWFGLE